VAEPVAAEALAEIPGRPARAADPDHGRDVGAGSSAIKVEVEAGVNRAKFPCDYRSMLD
jgi:hypothetical protein